MWIRASDSPSQTKTETRNRTRYRFRRFRWRYTHFVCVCAIWRALLYFINIYCEKDFHFRDNYDSISFLVLNEYCMRTVVWPNAINCGRVNVVYWYDKAEHLLLFHYFHYCSAFATQFLSSLRFDSEPSVWEHGVHWAVVLRCWASNTIHITWVRSHRLFMWYHCLFIKLWNKFSFGHSTHLPFSIRTESRTM